MNNTRGQYFIYNSDEEYTSIINELTTPFKDNKSDTELFSFWDKTDNIVFVPKHLETYVISKYDRIFV